MASNMERQLCPGCPANNYKCGEPATKKPIPRCTDCAADIAKRQVCTGCPSNNYECRERKGEQVRSRCRNCSKETGKITEAKLADRPLCTRLIDGKQCKRYAEEGKLLCSTCRKINSKDLIARGEKNPRRPKAKPEDGKDPDFCLTLGCMNPRPEVSIMVNGQRAKKLQARCNRCLYIIHKGKYSMAEYKNRYYHTVLKFNEKYMEKSRARKRQWSEEKNKDKQQRWEEMYKDTPLLKQIPRGTSKLAMEVYSKVFKALGEHTFKFKAEFNYLKHGLYQQADDQSELGMRADLLVEVDVWREEKPWTFVFEVQGTQHRPLMKQHFKNVKKQIERRYGELSATEQSDLFDIVRYQNILQLQNDLAKVLMSITQGFIHIIVYDTDSVETAIEDAFTDCENIMVYDPSVLADDKNAIVKQFVEQLLSPEGNQRARIHPCIGFELQRANSFMSKLKTGVIPDIEDDDTEDEDDEEGEDDKEGEDGTKDEDSTEDENDQDDEIVKMKTTISKETKDQGTILMWLEEIDKRFLHCKSVENLKIKFTGEHVASNSAQP